MARGDIIKFMEFKKNDIITIVIEDMGVHGEGIGKIQDETSFTFFVKDAVIGDVVEAKIMKVKKKLRLCQANENHYPFQPKSGTQMPL